MATLDLQVGASGDDVVHRGSTTHLLLKTSNNWRVGNNAASGQADTLWDSAARFINVAIPPGSIIDVAHLSLVAFATTSGTVVRTNIRAEAADSAAAITDDTDWHGRSLTTALTAWDSIAAWTAEDAIQSPDFKALVQEVIDRAGWALGNAMQIFWLNDGSDFGVGIFRDAYSWNGDAAKAPVLHVEYTNVSRRAPPIIGGGVF